MNDALILDTGVVESLWTGGEGTGWLEAVVNGDGKAAVSTVTVAEMVRKAPDRRAEIQLEALLDSVEVLDLSATVARRAGQIVRELDSPNPEAMLSAVVAATALENGLSVACIDDEFFSAMGCSIGGI
ncbi:MAG: PIN domain-containing protein [Dehalococcoidia bacterium]|nr:PIN domain-containing protein [Dehalococcoidia bacterium]